VSKKALPFLASFILLLAFFWNNTTPQPTRDIISPKTDHHQAAYFENSFMSAGKISRMSYTLKIMSNTKS